MVGGRSQFDCSALRAAAAITFPGRTTCSIILIWYRSGATVCEGAAITSEDDLHHDHPFCIDQERARTTSLSSIPSLFRFNIGLFFSVMRWMR